MGLLSETLGTHVFPSAETEFHSRDLQRRSSRKKWRQPPVKLMKRFKHLGLNSIIHENAKSAQSFFFRIRNQIVNLFFPHSFKEPFMRGFPRASQSLKASPKHYVRHREKDSKKAKGREQCQKIWNVSLHSFAFRLILHCLVVNDEIRLAKCSEAQSSVCCHHCLKPT